MHRSLIAITAAVATATLLAPAVASACSLIDPPRVVRILDDSSPDCVSLASADAWAWDPFAEMDVVNDCAEPIVIRCPEGALCSRADAYDINSEEAEIAAGESARIFVPGDDDVTLEWDDGSATGEITYTAFVRPLSDDEASACDMPFGCDAAVGGPAPAGFGWFALGLIGLVGLRRRGARG